MSNAEPPTPTAHWMSGWLIAAGASNLIWGALGVLLLLPWFRLLRMETPNWPKPNTDAAGEFVCWWVSPLQGSIYLIRTPS